jgi:AcrR family transcriptional regulator
MIRFADERSTRAEDLIAELSLDGSQPSTDGRRTRRVRNKTAVIDAYLDLVGEGHDSPSVAEVADRSGVSHRSVFRYFADKDELARSSIDRQIERLRPLHDLKLGPDAPLDDRVDHVLARRFDLYERIAPVARLMRLMAAKDDEMSAELSRTRILAREQLRQLFSPELATMPSARADDVLGLVDVLCSFEAAELLTQDQRFSHARSVSALKQAVLLLLQ